MDEPEQTEQDLAQKHVFKFFEVKDDDDDGKTFCIQSEWFNKPFDLNDNTKKNEEYCCLTVTDFNDYWQITIDRNLLLEKFKPSNALKREARNEVLIQTLQGVEMIRGQELCWAIVTGDKMKMKLKIFYEKNLPGIAGSFFIEKVDADKYKELNQLWYKNTILASRSAAETEKAFQLRLQDLEENAKKNQDTIAALKSETVEYKFSIFSNFTKVLNTKKDKINALTRELEKAKRRRDDIEEELAKMNDTKSDEENTKPPRKVQKSSIASSAKSKAAVQGSSSTQPLVSIKNESSTLPSSSRAAVTAPAKEDVNMDDSDSDSGDDIFVLMDKTL